MGADINFKTGTGRAIRILAALYAKAQRKNATVEFTIDDELKIDRLRWKLGTLFDLERPVTVVPAIPFEEGGVFHPSNLKIVRTDLMRKPRRAREQ